MPNVSVYLPEADKNLLEEARAVLGSDTNVSEVFRDCLRARIAEARAVQEGEMVELWISSPTTRGVLGAPRKVRFRGKMLAEEEGIPGTAVYLAPHAKDGNRFVFVTDLGSDGATMERYPSLNDAAADGSDVDGQWEPLYRPELIADAANALGEEWVEDLDS